MFATFLLYFDAVLAFVFQQSTNIGAALLGPNGDAGMADLLDTVGLLLVIVGGIAAGYFISNERKLGYYLGIAVAVLPLVSILLLVLRFDNVRPDLV